MWNGGCDETYDCDFQSLAEKHLVWLEVWLARFHVDGVCCKNGEVAFFHILVVYGVPHFDVVVANHRHIVADIVADVSHAMA